MRRAIRIWLLLVLPICHGSAEDFIKGITISAMDWGESWGTPEMATTLDKVKTVGANAMAIHPYAHIQRDGSLKFPADPELAYVTQPLDWARARGLHAMLVPHIAYWGSPWLWRGEIDFASAESWQRFFDDYEKWMTGMARIAQEHGADVLCVGLEYSHAVKFDQRWRQIIAAARREFHGKIVYGANWDTVNDVPFWDALDYIGVLAYFPLTKVENPTPEQIAAGWKPWMNQLENLSKKYGKRVLFTEIGYTESERAAAEPWAYHRQETARADEVQARCLEQALQLGGRFPFLAGMFLWKWYPDLPMSRPESFDLRAPALEKLMAKYWATPAPTGGR